MISICFKRHLITFRDIVSTLNNCFQNQRSLNYCNNCTCRNNFEFPKNNSDGCETKPPILEWDKTADFEKGQNRRF